MTTQWKRMATAGMAALVLLAVSSGAFAHDLWVNAYAPKDGVLKAELGYGHDFPAPEPIAQERLSIFNPLKLYTPDKVTEMEQKGENYAYEVSVDAQGGSYVVVGEYKPTFWSKSPEGKWSMTSRKETPDAAYSQEAVMFGKTILNFGDSRDNSFVTKPVGLRLEIVPTVNPANIKVGDVLPMVVFLDGKAAKTVEVKGVYGGFSKSSEALAFRDKTNLQGAFDFIPLQSGYWRLFVRVALPYGDKGVADESTITSSLTFHISE